MDLTEAKDVKKKKQECMEELLKKKKRERERDLSDWDNQDTVVTHLELQPWVWSQVGLRKHYYEQR